MRKNVAGQVISAQLVSASNGSPFTGVATVKVTGDNGTQTAGAGTVTHKGGGQHNYLPTQAETNFTHVAFLFEGAGAVSACPQVYTELNAAGVGAIEWDYQLLASGSGNPIADAAVWVTTDAAGDNVIASGRTDQNGIVTFYLDAGTVYVWRKKAGFSFVNPDVEVVS